MRATILPPAVCVDRGGTACGYASRAPAGRDLLEPNLQLLQFSGELRRVEPHAIAGKHAIGTQRRLRFAGGGRVLGEPEENLLCL